jgi:general secretion pathway protein K
MHRPGFALIAVFWIVMVVGLFAAIVAARTHFDLDRSGWAVAMGRVRAAADGAAEEAAFLVIERIGSRALTVDLTDMADFALQIDGIPVRVSVTDEDGKIDLNGAPPELLALLFEAVGLAAPDAQAIADRIADFRDPDNLQRLRGAEDRDYFATGLPAGAKDAPFDAVEELGQVLGPIGGPLSANPDLLAAVGSLLTVHAARSQFDPEVAPLILKPAVLEIEARGLGTAIAPSRHRIFSVTATASLPVGAVFSRQATFRITGDAKQPVAWMGWRVRDASGE